MVDDVHWQVTGVPASVKATLEVLSPIQDFASGIGYARTRPRASSKEQAAPIWCGVTRRTNSTKWSGLRPSSYRIPECRRIRSCKHRFDRWPSAKMKSLFIWAISAMEPR